jgi:hypothetical protein
MPDEVRLELEEAVEVLGGSTDEFQPRPANVIAARIIGFFCAVAGGTIAVLVLIGGNYSQVRLVTFGVGAFLVVCGLSMVFRSLGWSTYRLLLCRDGIVEVQGSRVRICRWSTVEKIVQIEKMDVHIPTLSQPTRWTVYYSPNQQLSFNLDSTGEIERLVKILWTEADNRRIAWNRELSRMG